MLLRIISVAERQFRSSALTEKPFQLSFDCHSIRNKYLIFCQFSVLFWFNALIKILDAQSTILLSQGLKKKNSFLYILSVITLMRKDYRSQNWFQTLLS